SVESSVIEFSEQGERTLRSVESSVIEFSEQGERTLRSVESSVIEFSEQGERPRVILRERSSFRFIGISSCKNSMKRFLNLESRPLGMAFC
ncbi:hypothetical protein, partial [Leptospira santarosai]|uniref:hypothetical protein n=1 Tax=Leptospira santarosai TaxID=28183 RepID=UPI0024AF6FD0